MSASHKASQKTKSTGARRRPVLRDQRGIRHSFDFTAGPDGGAEYRIRGIPTRFWVRVRAKARRERTSVRSIVLQHLHTWVARDGARAARP